MILRNMKYTDQFGFISKTHEQLERSMKTQGPAHENSEQSQGATYNEQQQPIEKENAINGNG